MSLTKRIRQPSHLRVRPVSLVQHNRIDICIGRGNMRRGCMEGCVYQRVCMRGRCMRGCVCEGKCTRGRVRLCLQIRLVPCPSRIGPWICTSLYSPFPPGVGPPIAPPIAAMTPPMPGNGIPIPPKGKKPYPPGGAYPYPEGW